MISIRHMINKRSVQKRLRFENEEAIIFHVEN